MTQHWGGLKVDVKVRVEMVNGDLDWTIDGKKPKAAVVDLPKGSGRHKFDFHLDDRTGSGLQFDAKDPIWVHENEQGQCPGQGIGTDQIGSVDCAPKKLSLVNDNSGPPRTLHYQLNFVDAQGKERNVDPAIKNGGST